MGDPGQHRFYGELATWWPLISPPDEYAEEAAYVARLLRSASSPVRTVLELGSGGGSNALHLKTEFSLVLSDLSEEMLDVSRALNPELEHIAGDMRSLRLHRLFDAVFIHDAIDYMTTEDDLRRAVDTAFAHCRPGGTTVLMPDETVEIFEPYHDTGGSDGSGGRSVRFLEWTRDPDPSDTQIQTDYVFLLSSDGSGATRVVSETHRTGLFPRRTWLHLMSEAGFDAEHHVEETTEDRAPRDVFVGRRPD